MYFERQMLWLLALSLSALVGNAIVSATSIGAPKEACTFGPQNKSVCNAVLPVAVDCVGCTLCGAWPAIVHWGAVV